MKLQHYTEYSDIITLLYCIPSRSALLILPALHSTHFYTVTNSLYSVLCVARTTMMQGDGLLNSGHKIAAGARVIRDRDISVIPVEESVM